MRKCSECEFRVETSIGTKCIVTCSNTKRKHNEITYRIKYTPMWCPFKRILRRKRKSSPRALLVKELDKLWRKAVCLRAGNQCEMTGKCGGEGRGMALNAHHVVGRSCYRTRWIVENGVCLTAGMHTLCWNSAHKNPLFFLSEMVKKRGQKWYDDLQKEAYTNGGGIKHTVQDLEDIKTNLKKEIAKYEGDI